MALFETTYAPYVPFGSRTLTRGIHGTDVAIVQTVYNLMLKSMNPPQGPMGSPIAITCRYDAPTAFAVKNIQSYFGLAIDGIVGKETFLVFGQDTHLHGADAPSYGRRTLLLGDQGSDVLILQNRLNCFRYANIVGSPATGQFDEPTASAVLAFVHDAISHGDLGIPQKPVASDGFYDASWLYTFAGGRPLSIGRNGFDVVFVQFLLERLGYYHARINGYFGSRMQSAVKSFQNAHKISCDGIIGPQTYYAIGLSNDQSAPSPFAIEWPTTVPSSCLNGVDNNVDLSSIAQCLANQGYSFVLRYLGGPCYDAGIPVTRVEIEALLNAGLMIGTIYSGANSVSAYTCGCQSLGQGQLDGESAAQLAASVGQPLGSAIYLDLQSDQVSPESDWLSYVEGWTTTVAAQGYLPGVYSSRTQLEVIQCQPFGGSALLYWVAHWITVGPLDPPPCPDEEFTNAALWQYSDGTTICGISGFDIDSLENDAGLFDEISPGTTKI